MSITAQVDTASIDVSLDMHELRTEINEIIDEAVPDMITEGIAKAGNHYEDVKALKMELKKFSQETSERLGELGIGLNDLEESEDIPHLQKEIIHIHQRLDELTARIVGAGCMLIGTRA